MIREHIMVIVTYATEIIFFVESMPPLSTRDDRFYLFPDAIKPKLKQKIIGAS